MSLRTLWKRTVALLAAVGLSACLAAGVSADDENSESEPAPALQPTEIVADIPTEYNTPFQLEWGGGSLYQLKGRLATMNCIADTIWVYHNNKWNGYNQYQVPSTLNKQFLTEYNQFIPAGELYASCYDICDFDYYDAPNRNTPRCLTIENLQENNFYNLFSPPINDDTPCTTNFDPRVENSVLPVMPTYPDVCIMRQEEQEVKVGKGGAFDPISFSNALYPHFPSAIAVYSPVVESERSKVILLNTEIHELCHTNQHWHFIENLQPDKTRSVNGDATRDWLYTQAGKTFIDLVGYTKNTQGEWALPTNTPYHNIYNINPIELSAELCNIYLIEKMGETQAYLYKSWDTNKKRFVATPTPNFNVNTYLTPQVRQWLETYMVLPDIR